MHIYQCTFNRVLDRFVSYFDFGCLSINPSPPFAYRTAFIIMQDMPCRSILLLPSSACHAVLYVACTCCSSFSSSARPLHTMPILVLYMHVPTVHSVHMQIRCIAWSYCCIYHYSSCHVVACHSITTVHAMSLHVTLLYLRIV